MTCRRTGKQSLAIKGINDGGVNAPDLGAYEYGGKDWTAGATRGLPEFPDEPEWDPIANEGKRSHHQSTTREDSIMKQVSIPTAAAWNWLIFPPTRRSGTTWPSPTPTWFSGFSSRCWIGSAQVLAAYGNGKPFLTRHAVGKGTVAYVSAAGQVPYPDNNGIFAWIMETLDVNPKVRVKSGDQGKHLVYSFRSTPDRLFLHVVNITSHVKGKESNPMPATTSIPSPSFPAWN